MADQNCIMVEIDLEKQPEKKETNPPPSKPKILLHRLTLMLFKLFVSTFVYIKSYFIKMAEEERVHPAPEVPSEGSSSSSQPDKPKKGRLSLILKIIAALVVVIVLANFMLWVVINPRKMKFYVTDARLTEFSLSDDNTLRYNLRLNFTVRNPNRRILFRYESIVDEAYYRGEKFDSGSLVPFHQSPKTTTGLDTWFSGVKRLSLDWDDVEEFMEHKSSGIYPVDVKIRVYSSIKLGKIHMGDFKVKVKCALKIPLLVSHGDGDNGGFSTTQCKVDFNPLIVIYSD